MDEGLGLLAGWLADFAGIVFIFSGVAKALSLKSFQRQVRSMGVMGGGLSDVFGAVLPLVETATGLLVIGRIQTAAALSLGLFMMLVFTGFVAWTLATGRHVACFCFGEKESKVTRVTLCRNVMLCVLFGLALAGGPAAGGLEFERVLSVGHALSGVLIFLAGFHLASLRVAYRHLL